MYVFFLEMLPEPKEKKIKKSNRSIDDGKHFNEKQAEIPIFIKPQQIAIIDSSKMSLLLKVMFLNIVQ